MLKEKNKSPFITSLTERSNKIQVYINSSYFSRIISSTNYAYIECEKDEYEYLHTIGICLTLPIITNGQR